MIFDDECGVGSALAGRLGLAGAEIVTVIPGTEFANLGEGVFSVNPDHADDYERLIEELHARGKLPDRIAHLWTVSHLGLGCQSSLDRAYALGFHSLTCLTRALANRMGNAPVELRVISSGMQAITGEEALSPEKALLIGACKVILIEHPKISCQSIDIPTPEPGVQAQNELIDQLLAEFDRRALDLFVAYRGGHRLAQSFERIVPDRWRKAGLRLRERGVYLITGGLGRLGLGLALHLAKSVGARLALLDVLTLPDRDQWDGWLDKHDRTDETARKIQRLRDLEANGGECLILKADVADVRQTQEAVNTVTQRLGEINGVIHAAGVDRDALIQVNALESDRDVLAPKAQGAIALNAIFNGKPLDFLIYCSSLDSITGRPMRVSSCAADAFLDACAHRNSREGAFPTVSINWETVDGATPAGQLRDEEVAMVFDHILKIRAPQVAVSVHDLLGRIERSRDLLADLLLEKPERTSLHPRPNLKTPYVAPRTGVEKLLCEIWQELFGISEVGVNDNFFELGGDSIMNIQIAARVNTSGYRLIPRQVLERPTISELAPLIESPKGNTYAPDDVAEFNWSEEDVDEFRKAIGFKFKSQV